MPFDGRKRLTPIADKAREFLGPNGERWVRHGYGLGHGESCIAQALTRCFFVPKPNESPGMTPSTEKEWLKYRPLLIKAIQAEDIHDILDIHDIFKWNDDPARTFADIEAALARFADLEAEMNMEKADAV